MTLTLNFIVVKYHWFRQHLGKKFVIKKNESENQKSDIFTKDLQGALFVRIWKLLCGFIREHISYIISRNVIFGPKWRYYIPKGGILEYLVIIMFWFIILL